MNNYLSDVMVDKFKILILQALKDIKVADLRKINQEDKNASWKIQDKKQ